MIDIITNPLRDQMTRQVSSRKHHAGKDSRRHTGTFGNMREDGSHKGIDDERNNVNSDVYKKLVPFLELK